MDVFNNVLCRESIKLEPKYINKNFKTELLNRLKAKVEGVCTKHGYIKQNSINIHKAAPGFVELIGLCGSVVYDIYFYADVCNPLIGSVVTATITNVNRFGILAEAGYHVDGHYKSVFEIIIAKNSINIQSDVNLENLRIGQEIRVEIIGRKMKLGENKISAAGRVIQGLDDITLGGGHSNDVEAVGAEEEDGDDDQEDDDDIDGGSMVENSDEEEEIDEDEDKNGGGSEFFYSEAGSVFSASEEEDDADVENRSQSGGDNSDAASSGNISDDE